MANIWLVVSAALASGVYFAILNTVVFLPASYILHKILDHSWVMKMVIGVFAILFSPMLVPCVLLVRLFFASKAEYLNLLPVFTYDTSISFIKPFTWVFNKATVKKVLEDSGAIVTNREGVKLVDEQLYKDAAKVGKESDGEIWKPLHDALLARAQGK
jgi:hypothetical protein